LKTANPFLDALRTAVTLVLACTVVLGVVYPLTITATLQLVAPHQANGSLVHADDGVPVGSELIGQSFTKPGHFLGRPSATATTPYDASLGAASNLSPTNPDWAKQVTERVLALRATNASSSGAIPVDLVTTSASGLDPEISIAAAEWQVPRVAAATGVSTATLLQLVHEHSQRRLFGFFGEPSVNVLALNLALDRRLQTTPSHPITITPAGAAAQ
jgi:K+-transporting ATPase ATPase C chain